MAYELSIEVFGLGEDPNHRSHWGFMIHQAPQALGDLLHVRVIGLERLCCQFEYRSGAQLRHYAGRWEVQNHKSDTTTATEGYRGYQSGEDTN
jgi:hypothetical protein